MRDSNFSNTEESSTRKAVVTGGSAGIGNSTVHLFHDSGFQVFTADINEPENLPGHFIPTDLTDSEQIRHFHDQVIETMGTPDILVCNAGRGIHEKLTEGDPDIWEKIFQLNVLSTLRLIRAFVPGMVEKKAGDVIFVSSVSSRHAYSYGGIYAATKAAIDMIAETLRLEVQPSVRVTVVHPGVVDTNFFEDMINGTQTPESIGWGALNPEQVADSILYAVNQPHEVMLNDIVIRPVAQPM